MNDGFTHPFHGKDSITYLCWNYLRYDKSNHDIINLFIKILTKNGDVFEETAILKGMKNK